VAFDLFEAHGYYNYASCASCGFDFAPIGKECRYEISHWGAPQTEYLALGPGAFAFIRGYIYCTIYDLQIHRAQVHTGHFPILAGKRLTLEDQMSRFMVLGIKCMAVKKQAFRDRFGVEIDAIFQEPLHRLTKQGLVEVDDTTIRVTRKGHFYIDNISKTFYNSANYRVPQPMETDLQRMSIELFSHR